MNERTYNLALSGAPGLNKNLIIRQQLIYSSTRDRLKATSIGGPRHILCIPFLNWLSKEHKKAKMYFLYQNSYPDKNRPKHRLLDSFWFECRSLSKRHSWNTMIIFCCTDLPPALTIWVWSTISSNCSVSPSKRRQLTSSTSIFPRKEFREPWESNPKLLGDKQACYLCAMLIISIIKLWVPRFEPRAAGWEE